MMKMEEKKVTVTGDFLADGIIMRIKEKLVLVLRKGAL